MKIKKPALHWQIIFGLILGIIWAIAASFLGWSQFTLDWIDPFGVIFINLLKLIAVPLILFSIIGGIAGMGSPSSLGKIGLKTLLWYIGTTILAVCIGLFVVNMLKPGKILDKETRIDNRIHYELWAEQAQVKIKDGECISCLPENKERVERISKNSAQEVSNSALADEINAVKETKGKGPLQPIVDMVPGNIFHSLSENGLMLQVIFFAILFGISLMFLPPDKAAPVVAFVDGTNEVFLKMVDLIMKAAPFFVFALLAGTVSQIAGDNPKKVLEIFKGLGWYSVTVLVGLSIVLFLIYPTVVALFTRKISYKDFFKALSPAQTLAFSTSSSAATLPVTFECVENNLKVDSKISGFVLPIGATVNMDGTSLYQAVAVVFMAQFHFIDLDLGQQLTIVFTATLASIGSAAVPSAGLVMLIIVLESVGLNPAWIAIIFPVDRILDMCRTVVNVTGDSAVSAVIAHSEGMLYFDKEKTSSYTI